MRRTVCIVVACIALLVAASSVLLVDYIRRPKLSDFSVQPGMTLAQVEVKMKRQPDSESGIAFGNIRLRAVSADWYREGISIKLRNDIVTEVTFRPPPTMLEKFWNWIQSLDVW